MAKHWYVLYMHVGREKNIVQAIREKIVQSTICPYVGEIKLPVETIVQKQDDVRKKVLKYFLPGYVFVELDFQKDMKLWGKIYSFFLNFPGVRSFVGGTRAKAPIPMSLGEMKGILERMGEIKTFGVSGAMKSSRYEEKSCVKIIDGPFSNFTGVIEELDYEKDFVKVSVQIFGRSTPVKLEFSQIEPA